MPVAEQAITHARDRGRAENKKISRYELLFCVVMLITFAYNTLTTNYCLQRLQECLSELNEFPNGAARADVVNNTLNNNVIEKTTEFKMNPCLTRNQSSSMEEILDARDWEGADEAEHTERTKNIKHQEDVSAIIDAMLRELTMNEASESFNDAAYKALSDPGICSSV